MDKMIDSLFNFVEIEGYIRINGQLAPDVFVEFFHVDDEIIPNKYIALATYGPASICIGLQTNGEAYIRNTGPKAMATGSTVIFSGSWTVGGQFIKSLLSFVLGRRWRYAYNR